MKTAALVVCLAFLLALISPAHATWSIAKLDKKSKNIVVAGASCSYRVYGIAGVVPGKGVAIVQAASSGEARSYAVERIGNNRSLQKILEHIVDPKVVAHADNQQYALLSFAEWKTPLIYTGEKTSGWHGAKAAPGFSVQANTMVSEKVVDAAYAVMSTPASSEMELIEQAYEALLAGSAVGGDVRCGVSTASSAFLSFYRKDDHANTPYLNLVVYGLEPGSDNAVNALGDLLGRWQKTYVKTKSFQQFVIPAEAPGHD